VSAAEADDPAAFGARADALLDRIAPLIEGQSAELQGAVIADMTAIWVAGHRVAGNRADGDLLREGLLRMHAEHVRELIAMYVGDADG